MSPRTDNLFTMIESLPIDVKTELVEKILASIQPMQKEIDEKWIKIAEERISQIELVNVQVIPGDEVFNEIKEKYSK